MKQVNGKTEKAALLLVFLLFLFIPLIRLYPYTNHLAELLSGTDDWNFYAKNALEIKRGGWLMPHFNEAYGYPGGFFYNYFVAGCFALFGENDVPVYMVQSILTGGSVVLVFLAFRNKMKPVMRWVFLLCLLTFALLDVSRDYSVRLLSENLAVFSIVAFMYCLVRAMEKNTWRWQLGTIVFLVITVLTRPALMPFAWVFASLLLVWSFRDKKIGTIRAIVFAVLIITCSSLIAIRNYIICGQFIFFPTLGVYGSGLQIEQFSALLFIKKALFMLGYLPALSAEYRIRPHWMLLWIGYIAYLFFRKKQFWKFEAEELPVHIFIFVYCGLSLVFVTVDSYGFRAFIPLVLIVLPFSLMALERIVESRRTHRR